MRQRNILLYVNTQSTFYERVITKYIPAKPRLNFNPLNISWAVHDIMTSTLCPFFMFEFILDVRSKIISKNIFILYIKRVLYCNLYRLNWNFLWYVLQMKWGLQTSENVIHLSNNGNRFTLAQMMNLCMMNVFHGKEGQIRWHK